ncbi:MAG: hypothetical protein H6820_05270, partial [Phycisphaerales bacterium]|nr:hypothetical protein [Phycisphaerales bacterium]
ISISVLTLVTLSLACSQQKPAPFEPEDHSVRSDREAPFNPPERYPEWAFDQPEFVKPAAPDQQAPIAQANDPHHFFTNKRIVMVEQPSGYTPEETPRIAVYYTNDNGFHWHKAGYFGREQSYFPLETDEDGDYGVNFVGPGQKPEEHTPAYPERMYHVDTMLPEVHVSIDPEKTWYDVGEDIRISWEAKDPHLEQFPVRIGMLMDFTASQHDIIELQRDLPDEGSIDYHISSETEGHEIVFRIEALDRASNLGLAYSHALQIKERADDQIISKATRHHDDRIRTARKSNDAAPPASDKKPTLAVTKSESTSTTNTMSESGSDAVTAKPKTRVKVVTIGSPASNEPKATAAPMSSTTPTPINSDKKPGTPMTSASNGDDDEIVKLLDCDEREAYEQTISPTTTDDAQPTANAATRRSSTNETQAHTMTIHEALAPLKEAIGKITDLKRPVAKNDARAGQPIATAAKPTPSQPIVAAAAPTQPVATATTTALRPASGSNTARPMAAASRTPIDTTLGNSLVAPMPGIVSNGTMENTTSHPWRALGATSSTASAQTWTLPEAKAAVSAKPTDVPQEPTNGPVLVEVRDKEELPAD